MHFLQVLYTKLKPRASAIHHKKALAESLHKSMIKKKILVQTSTLPQVANQNFFGLKKLAQPSSKHPNASQNNLLFIAAAAKNFSILPGLLPPAAAAKQNKNTSATKFSIAP
jgi:hypothetical protein